MKQDKILTYQLRIDKETNKPCKGFFREELNTLETWQSIVDGRIDVLSITNDIDIIFNDEFLINQLPFNRVFYDEEPLSMLGGNLICVRHIGDEFSSIQKEDVATILKYLQPVVKVENYLVIVPEDMCLDYKDK